MGQALNNWDVDIKLGEKHGIDSNSQLSQDALLKIISGAERGDKGNYDIFADLGTNYRK